MLHWNKSETALHVKTLHVTSPKSHIVVTLKQPQNKQMSQKPLKLLLLAKDNNIVLHKEFIRLIKVVLC